MNIINNSCITYIKNIYVISDIQGDLDLLIILLEICAKVIKRKTSVNWRDLANDNIPESEDFSKDNFNNCYEAGLKNGYDCLFGFEWCGNDSWVVINGDIIENCNTTTTIKEPNDVYKVQNEIKHVELKIMIFLKVLSDLAKIKNGNIVKIIGNHDHYSIKGDSLYISGFSISNKYKSIERKYLFYTYNKLFNNQLFSDSDKKYIMIKLNNFIFLHGSISKSIIEIIRKEYNNNKLEEIIDIINNYYTDYIDNHRGNSMLLYGGIYEIFKSRLLSPWDVNIDKEWCKNLDSIIELLCFNNPDDINKLSLVVGHSPQYHFYQDDDKIKLINSSHSKIVRDSNVHYISGEIKSTSAYKELCMETDDFIQEYKKHKIECVSYIGKIKFDVKFKNVPIVFGITCSCPFEINNSLAKIYRVDNGAAKVSDKHIMNFATRNILHTIRRPSLLDKKSIQNIILYIYRYYVSRLPQVLHIHTNDDSIVSTRIIRATLKYSFNHMYRNNVFPFREEDKKYKDLIDIIVDMIDNNIK